MFSISSALLLAFGFGFVIFFHELGHFLAAKWADVKVEQFAVGFGQALFSWRKGLGFRWGSTQSEYNRRLEQWLEDHRLAPRHEPTAPDKAASPLEEPTPTLAGTGTFGDLPMDHSVGEPTAAQLSRASNALGISETEYRLNWIPLGGYVKMLGQDDLKPGVTADDPRAYNNKTISQRMVIVSAGVVMNIILAFLGFVFIFSAGFKVAPPIVGSVESGSPAQQAYKVADDKKVVVGLRPGDRILYLNDKYQYDFEKIRLNTALLPEGPIPVYVRHPDGSDEHLTVVPTKPPEGGDFLLMGITQAYDLRGLDSKDKLDELDVSPDLTIDDTRLIHPGDVVTAIDGAPVKPDEFWKLDAAMNKGRGQPVALTVQDSAGQVRTEQVPVHFVERFGGEPVSFAGMLMRPQVQAVLPQSKVKDVVLPGDVIVSFAPVQKTPATSQPASREALQKLLNEIGQRGGSVNLLVLRNGKPLELKDVRPAMRISPEHYGLGLQLGSDEQNPVVADTIDGSPARAAGIPPGARLTAINGQPVHNWFDVNYAIARLSPDQKLVVTADVDGASRTFDLGTLPPEMLAAVQQNRLGNDLIPFQLAMEVRKTSNLLVAAEWGVGETRDAILQVYQTFRAMADRSISVKQVSSFVGIAAAGYKFAEMGIVRLVWFLSIISANLAVMNFLPIPIVDGGLFTFLIIEKFKGGPISPRVQTIAQVVGLVILLSVFLFATYQDVFYRLPFLSR